MYRGDPQSTELYSAQEIAAAAGVSADRVTSLLRAGRVVAFRRFVPEPDAIRLVRMLAGLIPEDDEAKAPIALLEGEPRRPWGSLTASGLLHVAMLLLSLAGAFAWLEASDTEQLVTKNEPIKLVYLMAPGPGGGGGGGGTKTLPPPPLQRRSPAKLIKHTAPPMPPVRREPPPPRPVEPTPAPPVPPPPVEPPPQVVPPPPPPPEPPKPVQTVQAPVASVSADPVDKSGLPDGRGTAPNQGAGTGGGFGSGSGAGMGPGSGGGVGPGTGGGTGGGPYQPGSGITPPQLLREVRPTYTDEARRRALEGDVVLEIVVKRDGSVGNVRVLRSLGSGLEQKAIEAVRQWKFSPASRQGTAVDVVVEVSVGFTLR